jgi:branched-chain amino acid transport system permease protein
VRQTGVAALRANNIGPGGRVGLWAAALVLVAAFPLFGSANAIYLAVLGLVGAVLALGLNIFFGYCGQINFGCAGYFAVGGYSMALLEKYVQPHFFLNLVLVVFIAGLVTWMTSHFLLRLRHHTLALGTLAFALAVYTAVSSGFVDITRGEDGMDLAPLFLFGSKMGDAFFYYLLAGVAVMCYWVSHALRQSRIGRAMVGIGQNEIASVALGVDLKKILLLALLCNGIMAGLAGGIYVKWIGWASPEYFSLMYNVIIVLSVVVGGTGSGLGAVFGGALMFVLPQVLIGFARYQLLVYGLVLAAFILFLPKGITGAVRSLCNRLVGQIDQHI